MTQQKRVLPAAPWPWNHCICASLLLTPVVFNCLHFTLKIISVASQYFCISFYFLTHIHCNLHAETIKLQESHQRYISLRGGNVISPILPQASSSLMYCRLQRYFRYFQPVLQTVLGFLSQPSNFCSSQDSQLSFEKLPTNWK